jgi:hypothetical protein
MSAMLRRRMFLRGMGGAALAIPFLPSMATRAQAADGAPQRFIMMISRFGVHPDNWYPVQDPVEQVMPGVRAMPMSSLPAGISPVLQPFDALRSKMAILRGFDVLGKTDNHFVSGPSCASTNTSIDGPPYFANSIDSVLSQSAHVYPAAPVLPLLNMAPRTPDDHFYASFTFDRGKAMVANAQQPEHMLSRLFANPSAAMVPDDAPKRLRLKMVDQVRADYQRVSNSSRISRDDRLRLDNFAQLMSEVEDRLQVVRSCSGPELPSFAEGAPRELFHRNMIDLAVAALACDATRVVTYLMTNVRPYSSEATKPDKVLHEGAHLAYRDRSYDGLYNRWIAERYAEFVSKLDAIEETNGKTLLDNSIAYWSMCQSSGSHDAVSMPVVVFGDGGGRLRTGQYMDFRQRDGSGALIPIEDARVGQRMPGSTAGRPINELLITFMRAMGLSPSDWRRDGLDSGFGHYDLENRAGNNAYYEPFVSGDREAALPYYYIG